MSDKFELKIAYAIVVVCLIVGIVCYGAFSAEAPEMPVRVMFQSAGGAALFDHMTHVDGYGQQCGDCHHPIAQQENEKAAPCGTCHTRETEYVPALGEKGRFDHPTHSENYGLSCADCHHEMEDMGSDPQACSTCHMPDAGIPEMAEVAHKQCIGCHGEMGAGPVTSDCGACHTPRPRTDAFHTQCIECHESVGSGPTNDDCKGCHGY